MSSIRKRHWIAPDGARKQAWQADYRDQAGTRRCRQFAKKRDAEAFLVQAASEVSQGTHTPLSQSVTVEKAAQLWLAGI